MAEVNWIKGTIAPLLICTLPDDADCPVLWQCVPWCEYLQETGGADNASKEM